MKVALVCNKFYPNIGGVETVVFELAKNLSSLGVDVTVLTLTDNPQLPKIELCENFRVLRFREFGLNNIKISIGLIKHLRKMSRNYDLIHVHNYHTFPAFIAALFSNNRFVFSPHYHGTGQTLFTKILHYPYWLLGAYIFTKADKVICDTDAEATLVKSHFKFVKNIQVIPLAINVKGLHDAKKINYGSEYILTVGRLENYKKIDLIIQSLNFLPKNLKLIIVGYGSQLSYLKQLIENLKLSDRVSIIDRIPNEELYSLFKTAKVFVSASQLEAYGLSLLEAAYSQIGTVATDLPSHLDIITRFKVKNVILISIQSSPKTIAEAIIKAEKKPTKIQGMPPSWINVAKQTLNQYVFGKNNRLEGAAI